MVKQSHQGRGTGFPAASMRPQKWTLYALLLIMSISSLHAQEREFCLILFCNLEITYIC